MAKKILGNLQVGRYASSQGRNLTTSVEGANFSTSGSLEIDSYTQDEFNKIVSVLPLSHYGSFNYIPAGVYGSYEGASDVIIYRYRKLFVEDDGTLMILRPGTNGSKRGVYYSYLNNILSTTTLSTSINTNKEYKPGYFGSTYTAKYLYATDNRVTSGVAFNASNEPYVFVSWMNGTLNDTQHTGILIPLATIVPSGTVRFVMTGNTDIYFFTEVSTGTNLSFEIRSIPISQVQAGGSYTITNYATWSTTGFYGTVTNSTELTIIPLLQSTSAAANPYMLIPAATTSASPFMTGVDIYAAQNSAGTIRLRVVGDAWCTTALRNARPKHTFSFLLNMTTKTATLEAGNIAPLTITDPGSGTVLNVSGSTYSTDPIPTINTQRSNHVMGYYYFDNGTTIAIGSPNQGDTLISRGNYPNATSVYDTLQVRSYPTSINYTQSNMNYQYGSPVGSNLMSMEWLPNNRYRVNSLIGSWVNSVNQYVPGATYTFDSVSFGTIQGYQPTVNRYRTTYDNDHRFFISTINGSTVTTNGGMFIENNKISSGVSYDSDMNSTGSMSIANSLLTSFKNSQLASSTITLDSSNVSNITLYVPQQTDCPAFALITAVTTTQTSYVKVVEVNVNTRTGAITSLTLKRLVYEDSGQFGSIAQPATYGVTQASTGLTIYDAGTFYFIGGADPYIYKTTGDSNAITFRAKVTKSTGQMDSFIPTSTYQNHVPNVGSMPFAAPGIGFGYIDYVASWADDAVRLIFRSCGTTLAQYNAWTDVGSPILLASQDVAQGFIIYFTEPTSLLLSGKSFTLPVQNIDLSTVKANPANSTFYIYAVMQEGLAKYIATETVIAESGTTAYNTFWIGTVTTNALQIETINIFKRSRLDVFGTSLEAAGSSIPVSYGLPTGSGTINW